MEIIDSSMEVYYDKEPYIFISYSREDIRVVSGIIRAMCGNGFRIWYDMMGEGIAPGSDWREVIDERLKCSRAFVIFLGAGCENRTEVMRELRMAIKLKAQDPSYVILPVFLNRIPISDFPSDVRVTLTSRQNLAMWLYGGVTERFINRLIGAECWNCGVVDDDKRRKLGLPLWNSSALSVQNFDYTLDNDGMYIYRYANPQLVCCSLDGREAKFYKVTSGEVSSNAVYPLVMDNQWVPTYFYEDRRFMRNGLKDEQLKAMRNSIQGREVLRSLLHFRQLIVNRAFLQNSAVFIQWYSKLDSADYEAFCRLIENGSIVLVLYREKSPFDKAGYGSVDWAAWTRLCLEHSVYCLRMDWDDDITNFRLTENSLGLYFHNFCVTMAENEQRILQIGESFGLSAEEQSRFKKKWKDIQRRAIHTREEFNNGYSREQFYKDNIVCDATPVPDCLIDRQKPFAAILKQIIDMRYNLNFANAYGVKITIPYDSALSPTALYELMPTGREITAEELLYAVGSFSPQSFLTELIMPFAGEMTLSQVAAARTLPQWEQYIRLVEEAGARSGHWDIDFYYIAVVWQAYAAWIDEIAHSNMGLSCKRVDGAVTIVFRIGNKQVNAVYRAGQKKPYFTQNNLPVGNGKQLFTIDYICGEYGEEKNNLFLTEIRLFNGRTHEQGEFLLNKLIDRLSGGNDDEE